VSKSRKHRALSAAHRAAKEANQLAEFYAMRDAARAPPPANPFDNYDAIRTPEITLWRENERYPRFLLPTNSLR
jgi:hypothetical protein